MPKHSLMAGAVLHALWLFAASASAQEGDQTLPTVEVTATPFNASEGAQILTPAKVLSGAELRNKLGTSLGATLNDELGVSASGFGAGASRPIIRGLEGPRLRIMQNGMGVGDVSTVSNDHAVAIESSTARQIEILRGPAALLYGSGAIGGLVNIVNDRIPTELMPAPTGEAELRYSTADQGKNLSFATDAAAGTIGLHLDGHARTTGDYRIPGFAAPGDAASSYGVLPISFTHSRSLGFGASHIGDWGYVGASVATRRDRYGIPTAERSSIDLSETRFDADGLVRKPVEGIRSIRVRLASTDYEHVEQTAAGAPASRFLNRTLESRWEAVHEPLSGWRGTVGIQTERNRYSALSASTGRADTVPITRSSSVAAFIVEEKDVGPFTASAGLRLENLSRSPERAGLQDRSFNLASYSVGGLWRFLPGYGLGTTLSIAQRAPGTEELYSNGPHESTASFDIGNAALGKETSRNIELSLQKTEGLVRWRGNLFQNRVKDFIYARDTGVLVDESGAIDPAGEFRRRLWSQGDATIRGAEAEVSYNLRGDGLSLRAFADTSRGRLDGAGNLPLQPASRIGLDAGYKRGAWRSTASLIHAYRQERLASFEANPTPGYTRLDASLSYDQRIGRTRVTWFMLANNLLNQDIRLSTSLLREVAPQPGRNVTMGVRTTF
ncbi:iron complex outermembrane recepter protein [Noviherbaspirillum humi]|uniref:Iron complex outermembrane recepter protein n=1 Tax=Noviherbaspirillum humi TaxID=1688639 RepID=A0A239CEC7_9BURK|nr:TonB-dependent receptor [Noviherbaspirillum humi]SNS18596.1 iron complex outermembrane recepter protein [Noviherbaspirillum humi]